MKAKQPRHDTGKQKLAGTGRLNQHRFVELLGAKVKLNKANLQLSVPGIDEGLNAAVPLARTAKDNGKQ
jgi:hypothetical protein